MEAGDGNHISLILSQREISKVSNDVTGKINKYINQKCEEYLAAKTSFESTKSQIDEKIKNLEDTTLESNLKYQDAAKKLLFSEETLRELENKLNIITGELQISQSKVIVLENEYMSMKSARDTAVDEKNDLARVVDRHNLEIERLTASELSLSQQLRVAIDSKCEAWALADEIKSKENVLQNREKQIEQERTSLNSQIHSLTEQVNRLTSELETVRLNNTCKIVDLETQLATKDQQLNIATDQINELNKVNKDLTNQVEKLTHRLKEREDFENRMADNYKMELDAKAKLADLFKTMHEDSEAKTKELNETIAELQKQLNEASEKYGELETIYKQVEFDQKELIRKKNEKINSLETELKHNNDLLKASNTQNLETALSNLAPSAATTSRLIKSGMSLTQIYSELVKMSDELAQEKEKNRQLNIAMDSITQELEEKAPLLKKEKAEYLEAMESKDALSQQIESLTIEYNRLKDDYSETTKIASHYNRENTKLKGELADLGRQVCFLLKEIEHSRDTVINGDHETSQSTTSGSTDLDSSRNISKTLITFRDIQELQSNNQKLLTMIRELSAKQEELEQQKEQFQCGSFEDKIENLKQKVVQLTEAQDQQTKMVNALIRQRDMFKKLYHDQMKGKRLEDSASEQPGLKSDIPTYLEITQKTTSQNIENNEVEIETKLKETEKHLEMLKEEFKSYKEEKITTEGMLFEQAESMRQEIAKLTEANSKSASTLKYNNERLKNLQTNIATYKKQISILEEKNKAYNTTIAKQEISLQQLRDTTLTTQGKLAAAEVQIENLKTRNKLLKDIELRLQTEKEALNRERQGQCMLQKNLELIKVSLERNDAESRMQIESRLDATTKECAALKKRLQEEQDKFRELSAHLERQTETAKTRFQDEKDAADKLRIEVQQLRNSLDEKNKLNDDLVKKLKSALSPANDDTLDTIKKIRELENKLSDMNGERSSLLDQLNKAKEQIKQKCDIAEETEKQLENIKREYESYKLETTTKLEVEAKQLHVLKDKCAELEAEISLQAQGEYPNVNVSLRNELAATKEELTNARAKCEACHRDLHLARTEINNLSEAVRKSEEKYSHELMLHSTDLQTLSQVKEDLSRVQNELSEMVALKNGVIQKLETQKAALIEKEKVLVIENEEIVQRLKDLSDQNTLLHDQIQALGKQLSGSMSRSFSESMNESANDSTINISASEDDGKSCEQLLQIVNYLRKEKDILLAKFGVLQAETNRLKSQLEINEKQLDECRLALVSERARFEMTMATADRQSDILRKLDTFNAITDSNRFLRDERASLSARLEEFASQVKSLQDEIAPLHEKINELTSKNEALDTENKSLKSDCARWRSRVNSLVERANKTSPEDWKRLQNERETLAKMLTNEKESNKKVKEALSSIEVEKRKLEEKYKSMLHQQNSFKDENNKLREELRIIKEDMARLSEELTRIKTENTSINDAKTKMAEDLSNKESFLTDIRNKEMQIRKIAKKYKGQYEELVKTIEEEKKKHESDSATAGACATNSDKQIEEQLKEVQTKLDLEKTNNEQLKQELEVLRTANSDKEEKAKAVLKHAKSKIVQLTEIKSSLSRDLEEARSKIESVGQSNRDDQDDRLALIKSQYEGRLARLEKEHGEAQAEKKSEIEALMQKVTLLQKQLASQASGSKQQIMIENPAERVGEGARGRHAAGVDPAHGAGGPHGAARRAHHRDLDTSEDGFERSEEVEYQVPTSSRCDQDDEGVVVVDSEEDDERCSGTMYQDSPAQSLEVGEASEAGEAGSAADSEPAAQQQQIEAISSGTEPSGTLSIGGNGADDGDDSIVPSTPTLYVPRRNDGFGEAVVSPVGGANVAEEGSGATGARFTFAEAAHHD
ncbi:unnamed protein product, partial [Leptidea sinapis]